MNSTSFILCSCGRIKPAKEWHARLHCHQDNHELIVVVSGRIRTEIAGRVIVGQKGDALFYPRRQAHQEQAIGEEPLETIFFPWRQGPRVSTTGWPLVNFDPEGRIEYLARWIHEIYPPKSSAEAALVQSLFDSLLHRYAHPIPGPADDLVLRIRRFVTARLSGPLSLDLLAAEAALSPFHFARVFRQASGQPPMTFVRRLRMEAAKSLLIGTPLPLKAVAAQVGMANEQHLSRVFKKVFGRPPRAMKTRR